MWDIWPRVREMRVLSALPSFSSGTYDGRPATWPRCLLFVLVLVLVLVLAVVLGLVLALIIELVLS